MKKTDKRRSASDGAEAGDARSARADRAFRALRKGMILDPPYDLPADNPEFSAEKRTKLVEILLAASPTISATDVATFIFFTEAFVGKLMAARETCIDSSDIRTQLAELLSGTKNILDSWTVAGSNHTLRNAFNTLFDDDSEIDANIELKRKVMQYSKRISSQYKYDAFDYYCFHITWALNSSRAMFDVINKILVDGGRIGRTHEYSCVKCLAFGWRYHVGSDPTMTRNREASETPPKTSFQNFLETALSGRTIGDEVIRAVIENLKYEERLLSAGAGEALRDAQGCDGDQSVELGNQRVWIRIKRRDRLSGETFPAWSAGEESEPA